VRTLSSLTRAQLDALPAQELVSVRGIGGGRWQAKIEPRNDQQDDLATQLLTTISTLVVAVAGFYFGSKSVREATTAVVAAGRGDTGTGTAVAGPDQPGPGGTDEDEEVDETGAYGERSPVTGLGQSDIEDEVDTGGETADAEDEEPEDEAAATVAEAEGAATVAEAEGAAEPALEDHPDYQDEPDFYPDEDDEATDADEDSPPAPAEGDDDRA